MLWAGLIAAAALAVATPQATANPDPPSSAPLVLAAHAPVASPWELDIAQYHQTRWTREDGAPGIVNKMGQTPDGFLWLATGDGLFRFDGLTFERISEAPADTLGNVTTLMIGGDGAVWAWFHGVKQLGVYRDGKLLFLETPSVAGTVTRMAEGKDGAIWLTQGEPGAPLLRYSGGAWTTVDAAAGLPRAGATGLEVTRDGAVWVSYTDYTLRKAPGGALFERVSGLDSTMARLTLDSLGRLWHLDRSGARIVTHPGGSLLQPLSEQIYPTDQALRPSEAVVDTDGNLWEVTKGYGVTRVNTLGSTPRRLDRFRAQDGLSSDSGGGVFLDREGSIWVGTGSALERFRRPTMAPERLDHVSPYGPALLAATNGDVYIGSGEFVYRAVPGGELRPWQTGAGDVESLCEAPDRSVWILGASSLRIVTPTGQSRTIDRPPAAQRELYDCAFDQNGEPIIAAGEDGTFRLQAGQWEQTRTSWGEPLLGRSIVRDSSGSLWATIARRGLARWEADHWVEVLAGDDVPTGTVMTIHPTERGLLFAGQKGVALLQRDGRTLGPAAGLSGLGLLETSDGDLWLTNRLGVVRVDQADLRRALSDPSWQPPKRTFVAADGLTVIMATQKWRTLVQGGDGRIWVATQNIPFWFDPKRIPRNDAAPPVRVTLLKGEGLSVRDPVKVEVPAGVSDLTLNFAALSLRIPQRVQVRYRLEGVDREWVDPGQRRQAFYTNLSPGKYSFRVIAANEDGVWNRDGALVEFTLAPTFWQSIWFKFLIGIGALVLLGGAYILRMRQVTAAMRGRFQIRLAERERIARELHDTLLQGVQGLVLRFQAVSSGVADADVRAFLEETLDRADALVVEGRARLRDLRRDAADIDLGRAIADAAAEIIAGGRPSFQLVVEGDQPALQAAAADELLRIAEEAIRNAILHGEADQIEVLLIYSRREVKLAVRDNGKGIPDEVLKRGQRSGHFGLIGMRERAERIGGRFAIASRADGGTEVSVAAPATRAYRDDSRIRWSLLTKLWRSAGSE